MSADRVRNTLEHMRPAVEAQPTAAAPQVSATPSYPLSPNEAGLLTPDQQQFYEDNGFLVIRRLVPLDDLERYRQRFVDICDGRVERASPTMTVMRDVAIAKQKGARGEQSITKIQDWQDDSVLFDYCKHPAIVPYVQAFTGSNVKSVHTMLINKPPNVGESGRHPLHQDLMYFPFRPAERIVCSWTAMEKVNRSNGCLVVLPGSHKGELLEHGTPQWESGVNKAYWGVREVDGSAERVHLEMEAGDTVFFHPILIHGSGWNRTKGYRKAISCHYASADCHFIDVAGTVQAPMGAEVMEMLKIKLKEMAEGVSFVDVWRAKSRLVAGREGTLQ